MPSDDIYGMRESSDPNRRKRSAVSQRRDEYLRAIGEETVHRRRHHRHHGEHHQSSGRKAAVLYSFLSLGALMLLIAGAVWWLMHKR